MENEIHKATHAIEYQETNGERILAQFTSADHAEVLRLRLVNSGVPHLYHQPEDGKPVDRFGE